MTSQKTLKRRIRARMAKTGERYAAARAQVVHDRPADAQEPVQAAAEAVDAALQGPEQTTVPDAPARRGASDEALLQRTGHEWAHWYRVLDAWGAKDRSHTDIARFLTQDVGVDGWWAQDLTVRYEMAIGRRELHQRSDGFEATATKTLKAVPDQVYDAIAAEAGRAAWLDRPMRLRRANKSRSKTAYATVRFDWDDAAARVVFWLADKGDRTTVSLAHQRLESREAAESMKAFWRERLAALAAQVEGR